MTRENKTFFNLVVEPSKVHPNFERLRNLDPNDPTRRMLDDVYQYLDDPEGNFLEQFQTTGFDQRFFEIYLFAYFNRSGFVVNRKYPNPDFLVSRLGVNVAVEATTVNPPTSGAMAKLGRKINELSPDEFQDYVDNELAIRFGSPLYSKLQKKYWELEQCHGLPFVIAIEAFHDDESLIFTDASLTRYLYGLEHTARWDASGALYIDSTSVKEHKIGDKVIISNFFSQQDTEHISAVVFTNSGTQAKFSRMGYQHGFGCDTIDIVRTGICFNPDPDAMDPTFFSSNMNEPPFVETWGQGLIVLHNPNCLNQVPQDFFVNSVQGYLKDGKFIPLHREWHPFASKTYTFYLGEIKEQILKKLPRSPLVAVDAIKKDEFHTICGLKYAQPNPIGDEHGWFADQTNSFFGVIIQDKIDHDWGYVILARDKFFDFRAIETKFNFPKRDVAVASLQTRIAKLLENPKRIFEQ